MKGSAFINFLTSSSPVPWSSPVPGVEVFEKLNRLGEGAAGGCAWYVVVLDDHPTVGAGEW